MATQVAKWAKWRLKELTPELVDELAGHFRNGATLKIAAGRVEIPPATLREWLRAGEEQLRELYDGEPGYPNPMTLLYVACAKATAEYLAEHVDTVSLNPADRDWRASSWLLERRDEDFNPAAKVEVTSEHTERMVLEGGQEVKTIAEFLEYLKVQGHEHLHGLAAVGADRPALPRAGEVLPDHGEPELSAGEPSGVPGS